MHNVDKERIIKQVNCLNAFQRHIQHSSLKIIQRRQENSLVLDN